MRRDLALVLLASTVAACALVARSPALQSPLHERLMKADTPTIEAAAKDCLVHEGWNAGRILGGSPKGRPW